jgi:hypothetical protein
MPMHDWTKAETGVYHSFHSTWIAKINEALMLRLPKGYYSLQEQFAGPLGPDILALSRQPAAGKTPSDNGGTATLARPRTKVMQESADDFYARKQRIVAIRHVSNHRLVAVVELVSPGNKDSRAKYAQLVEKAKTFLEQKIHLLVIDPFPPPKHHPRGLHYDIVEEKIERPYKATRKQPLCLMSYECDDTLRAYVEPLAVGDRMLDMPIYLEPEEYIDVPLQDTYDASWKIVPDYWQEIVTG